jgi:hypothetical protein
VSIGAMAVANTEQIAIVHDEILDKNVSILIDFIFFVNSHPFPVAKCVFGYGI